jgi:hypothetical protein
MKGRGLAALVLAALLTGAGPAPAVTPPGADRIVLTLPRPPAPGEAVWLTVRVGALGRGPRVLVLADDGTLLGVVSPFAIAPGRPAGTYTIPLPEHAVREGHVAVRVLVEERQGVTRAPARGEIEDLGLEYVRVSR